MAFINTVVARAAASIWGLKLGNATMNAVLSQIDAGGGSITPIVNAAFNDSYSTYTNAQVAAAFVSNLGLTGATATAGTAYVVGELNGVAPSARGQKLLDIATLFSGAVNDATYGAAAAAFNAKVAAATAYSATAGSQDSVLGNLPSATSFNLTTGQDNITATAGADTFNAFTVGNANTLQDADYLDGGAGSDTLSADMGSSQSFAVTPQTVNVETIKIRAQSRALDTGDNNVANENRVSIDAQRIDGELRYEDNNSRADLIIEDVRIADSQITKDITIAMVQTDPGHVDFGVYFDQPSLRASSTSSATLTLELLDQRAAAEGAAPLRDSPYDGFRFQLNGVDIQFTSAAFQNAQTYAELLTAIQAQLALDPRTNGVVTAALGGTFTVVESTGVTVSGTQVVLSATNATLGVGSWIALAGVPATTNFYTNQFTGISSSNDLITSTILLDDVGRGSNGGDLVVGGLSVGETSTSIGVARFEITVERTSRLQNIDSTNDALKEVTVKNGTTAGNLTVLGDATIIASGGVTPSPAENIALPGSTTHHDTWGFNDVRLIDASAMSGVFTMDAIVTSASFAKYITTTDTQADPAGDNVSVAGKTTQRADFIYSGGSGNDSMNIQVSGAITASHSTILPGREDFTFRVNGNNGNDSITFRIVDSGNDGLINATGLAENWYLHQKALANVTIDAGEGNDTVRTPGAGDDKILLGGGNDVTYVDNTGGQAGLTLGTGAITNTNTFDVNSGQRAVWAFNTLTPGGSAATLNLNDLRSDANDTSAGANNGSLFRATVTVTYKGLVATAALPAGVHRPTDLYVNQAIKAAINNDSILSKLIVAEDGPAYSLVVKSLIDGVQATGDLAVVLTALDATDAGKLTETAFLAAYAALEPTDATPTRAELQVLLDNGITNFNAAGDYVTVMATDGTTDVVGAASITPSDNTITPAAGDDLIVLGTTVAAAAPESSNDTVVYSGSFGNDTIVYFKVGAAATGGDKLNLTALGGTVAATAAQYVTGAAPGAASIPTTEDKTVHVHAETVATDTAAEIAGLFIDSGSTTAARTFVYIAVQPTNKGLVYSVTDPVGGANVTATLMGSIDLADTAWATLTLDNFS